MSDLEPEFGVRLPDVVYQERPGGYAIIRRADGRLAFVCGKAGRLFLPGGGVQPGERPEDALLREIIEEIGWRAHILDRVGRATQFLAVAGEGCFAVRATHFRARPIERLTTDCEHAIVWLPAAAATASLARESDIWAISRGCDPDAIRR
jgi:8-oxo-dGTP diphosphatase